MKVDWLESEASSLALDRSESDSSHNKLRKAEYERLAESTNIAVDSNSTQNSVHNVSTLSGRRILPHDLFHGLDYTQRLAIKTI